MKKLLVLASLMVVLAPYGAKAHEDHDRRDKPKHHNHIKATEMAGMGFGAGALVGLAGYFWLRRRLSA